MSLNPYDTGGPIYVGDEPLTSNGDETKVNYDITDWDLMLSNFDDMSPEQFIDWIVKHPDFASTNASALDSMLQQKYNRSNYDYEYEKNRQMLLDEREYNSMKNVMARLKEAGVNPALAFRTGENAVAFSNPTHGKVSSNIASQFAKEASLEESKRKTDISGIFQTLGAIAGFIAMLIAL